MMKMADACMTMARSMSERPTLPAPTPVLYKTISGYCRRSESSATAGRQAGAEWRSTFQTSMAMKFNLSQTLAGGSKRLPCERPARGGRPMKDKLTCPHCGQSYHLNYTAGASQNHCSALICRYEHDRRTMEINRAQTRVRQQLRRRLAAI